MRLLIMFLLLALGHDLPAHITLVVHPRAADLVHPVFAQLDVALASVALLLGLLRGN